MNQYEEQYQLIQRILANCKVDINIIGLSEDNRFIGILSGETKEFVVSRYCNHKYTWSCTAGSIQERGPVDQGQTGIYKPVESVIGGQLEMSFF